MSTEADEVAVARDDRGHARISLTHGNYITSMSASEEELRRIRDAINEFFTGGQAE